MSAIPCTVGMPERARLPLENASLDEFLTNSEKRFATIKQIEIIGEACVRITSPVKGKYPDVEMEKHHWLSKHFHS